jgi:hypothetical protein
MMNSRRVGIGSALVASAMCHVELVVCADTVEPFMVQVTYTGLRRHEGRRTA